MALPAVGVPVFSVMAPAFQAGAAPVHIDLPQVAQGGLPFPGMGNPALVAAAVLIGQAVGRGLLVGGKKVGEAYVLDKVVKKIDEGISLFEPKSHREQRLLNQLGDDLLRGQVLSLMANTEQMLADPTIPPHMKIEAMRGNYTTLTEIISHNLGDRPHLSEQESSFLRWSADKTEKAIHAVGQYYSDLPNHLPQSPGEQDDVCNQIAEQIGELNQAASGLDMIQQNVESASHSIQEALDAYQKEDDQQMAISKMKQHLAIAQTGFAVAGFIAQICGNDQLAQKIAYGGQAVTSVANSAIAIASSGMNPALATVFPHYVAIAVAIHSLISLIANQDKQEQSTLAAIMEQLKILSSQVKQLHTDLHVRFHELNRLLAVQHYNIMKEFAALTEHNQVAIGQLKEIKEKIDNNALRDLKYFNEILLQEFQEHLFALKEHDNLHDSSHPANVDELKKRADKFYLWATHVAKSSPLLTDSISCHGAVQNIAHSDLSLHLEQIPLEGNIQFLAKYAKSYIPELVEDPVNSFEWIRASNAYLHLRNLFPHLKFGHKETTIKNMIACGQKRLTLSKQLQKSGPFFEILCQSYKKAANSCQLSIQHASFESIKISLEQWSLKLNLLAETLHHEKQGDLYAQSQLAKYKQQSGTEGAKRLKKLALDYEEYITKLQERLAYCESTFQSVNVETFPKFLQTPGTLQPFSTSLIVFLQELPLDLHGLFQVPQEALVAELLGIGHLDIGIKIVEVEKKLESPKTDELPIEKMALYKKGNYLKSKCRFEIIVKFKPVAGQSVTLLTAQSSPLFFPGYHWIRKAIKGSSKLPSQANIDESHVIPKKWGHKEHNGDYTKWYGDVGQAVRACSAAYLLKNFEYAKENQLFQIQYEPAASFSLQQFITSFQKNLCLVLTNAISYPSTLATKNFSESATSLDATQKLLKAYCSLAFPQSIVIDLTSIQALSYPKELWSRKEVLDKLEQHTYPEVLQQLTQLNITADSFHEHLKKKINVSQNEDRCELDPDVNNMILRLQAYHDEKY